MWCRKLTILDFETPLAATRLPTRRLATSLSRASNFPLARLELPSRAPRDFPLARLATRVGLSNRGSKSEWAHGGRGSLTPLGPSPLARRPRRVPLAGARRPPRLPLAPLATIVRAPLPVGYLPKLISIPPPFHSVTHFPHAHVPCPCPCPCHVLFHVVFESRQLTSPTTSLLYARARDKILEIIWFQ